MSRTAPEPSPRARSRPTHAGDLRQEPLRDRAGDRLPAGISPLVHSGWGALALASLLAGWGALPLLRAGGPDLSAFRPPAREAPGGAGGGGSAAPQRRPPKGLPAARLDLNRATPDELAGLPGIGPSLAARIVEHRQTVGPFPHPEALRAVPGIGPRRYAKVAPHLTIGAANPAPQAPAQTPHGQGRASRQTVEDGEHP